MVCVRQRGEGGDTDEEFDEEPISGSDLHLRRQVSSTHSTTRWGQGAGVAGHRVSVNAVVVLLP